MPKNAIAESHDSLHLYFLVTYILIPTVAELVCVPIRTFLTHVFDAVYFLN